MVAMMQDDVTIKEIEGLIRSKGAGPVLINALELPWISKKAFDASVQTLIEGKRLSLIDSMGDLVFGDLIHYEVEATAATRH